MSGYTMGFEDLLSQSFTTACKLDLTSESDGFGGFVETWKEGATFDAAFAMNGTTDAQIAQQSGQKRLFTVLTKQTAALRFNDRIKRLSDGLVLRITSNAADMATPGSSDLKLYQVTAEAIEP